MTLHQNLRRTLTSAALLVLAAFSPAFAQPNGEIELAVTQKPPKLMSGDALVKYFSGALRATYRSDEGRPIEVAFRAWLVTSDGKMDDQCTSSSFEIAGSTSSSSAASSAKSDWIAGKSIRTSTLTSTACLTACVCVAV